MKNIKISGSGMVYRVYHIIKMEDFRISSFPNDMMREGILGEPIEVALIKKYLCVECDGKRSYAKKGEYIKRQDFISSMVQTPCVAYQMGSTFLSQSFDLQIEDGEKFVPAELQLHKTYEEIPLIPYGIIPTEISYQGVVIKGKPENYYRNDSGELYPSLPTLQQEAMPYFNLEQWLAEKTEYLTSNNSADE